MFVSGSGYEKARIIQRKSATGSDSSAPHRFEELGVGLGGAQLVDQELRRLELVHREEQLPQHPHLLQDRLVDQQLLAARAGAVDVDRGIDALLMHAAVEVHL